MPLWAYAILVPVGIHALMTIAVGVMMLRLRKVRLTDVTAGGDASVPSGMEDIADWASRNGFNPPAMFTESAGNALVIAWQHAEHPQTYLTAYSFASRPRPESDLVTIFDDDVGLTTGSTRDGVMNPRAPGKYAQCFEKKTLDERWLLHIDACDYLVANGNIRPPRELEPFVQLFERAVRAEARHLLSTPLWWLFTSYWYVVRRGLWVNVSIEEQHRRGWIRLA